MSEPDIDPYRICCGKQHYGPTCPDGRTMCCLCFESCIKDELFTDASGATWDVCKKCQTLEDAYGKQVS